jgi:Tol biopolymer transport system component
VLQPPHLAVVPTGVGTTSDLPPDGVQQFFSLGWAPGGEQIYFAGNDGHNWRMYMQDLSGGKPRPFTPPISINPQDFQSEVLSPDGKVVFARDLNGKGWLYPLAGAQPQPVLGLTPEDIWVNWSSDRRSAYLYQDEKIQAQLFRIDLSTGKRQLVTTLGPGDPAGLTGILPVRITPDGKSYAYSYNRSLSDLFLVEGVK